VTGANGCTSQASTEVELDNSVPGAQTGGGTLTCTTTSIELQGSGNGTFAWTGPNGFTSTEQNPVVSEAGTYTLVVTGANGCTSQASTEVTLDNDAPIAMASATPIGCTSPATLSGSSTTDGATFLWTGPEGFSSTLASVTTNVEGIYILTVTGPNGCATSSTVIVVEDCEDECPPMIISCPADITVSCAVDFSPFGVGGEPVWGKKEGCPEPTSVGWTDVILSNCPYVIQRTFWAENAAGDYESCSHTITVIDDVAPIFMNVPADLVVNCGELNDNMEMPDVWAYDECTKTNVNAVYTVQSIPGSCVGTYTMVHTWTATDQCGNTGTASWTISVVDTDAPVFDCVVADVTVTEANIPEVAMCKAYDACAGEVQVNFTEQVIKTDACAEGYALLRTWTAMDNCDNGSALQQTITVCDPKSGKDGPWAGAHVAGGSMKVLTTVSPNPFRDECEIAFIALEEGHAMLEVSDLQGRKVAELYNGQVSPDQQVRVNFRPVENGSGLFIYRIMLNGTEVRGRMLYQP